MLVYCVVDSELSPTFQLGTALETFLRRVCRDLSLAESGKVVRKGLAHTVVYRRCA